MQWFYTKDGRQFGPIGEDELFRLAREGEIGRDDLVWNPELGGQWIPAGSVENLFSAPAFSEQPPVPGSEVLADAASARPGIRGVVPNRDLMRMARESLRGNWGLGVGVALLFLVIDFGVGFIPVVGTIASWLIAGPLTLGFNLVF